MIVVVAGGVVRVRAGGNVEVRAFVERNELALGERTRLTYQMEGEFDRFVPPEFEGVRVVGGPFQSTSIQIINFNIRRHTEYTYIIEGVQEGIWHIRGGYIEAGRQRIPLPEVVVKVSGGRHPSQVRAQPSAERERVIWIEARVSNRRVRVGEPVVVSYWLYSYFPVMDLAFGHFPQIANAWSYEVDLGKRIEFQQVQVGERSYFAAEVLRRIFYPRQAGILTIDSLSMKVVVQVHVQRRGLLDEWLRSDPFFRQFFSGIPLFEDVEPRGFSVSSEPVEVRVEPLPTPQPSDFSGFVGRLSAELRVSDTSVRAGEGVTFKLVLQGRGNLDVLGTGIELRVPPGGFEVYAPQVERHRKVEYDGVQGTVTLEWVAIGRQPGSYSVGVTAFTYFDPTASRYVRVEIEPVYVRVVGGGAGGQVISAGGGGGVPLRVEVLSPIEGSVRLIAMDWQWRDMALAGGLFLLPFFVGLAMLVIGRLRMEQEETRLLRQAMAALSAGQMEKALGYMERALYVWAWAKAGTQQATSLSHQQLAIALAEECGKLTASRWQALVERVQQLRYCPSSQWRSTDLHTLIADARKLFAETVGQGKVKATSS